MVQGLFDFFMFLRSYCSGNLQYQIEVSFFSSEKLKIKNSGLALSTLLNKNRF